MYTAVVLFHTTKARFDHGGRDSGLRFVQFFRCVLLRIQRVQNVRCVSEETERPVPGRLSQRVSELAFFGSHINQ
jgi:hypothetical protein